MKFKLYREFGSLNSKPVFDALQRGIQQLGYTETTNNEDVSVIWSVLWHGRMAGNQQIYERNLRLDKPTLVLEVGNLRRGLTWRLSLNNVNQNGYFGNNTDLDLDRPSKLGIQLNPWCEKRNNKILIACQHEKSLQWQGQPPMHEWVNLTIDRIRQYSNRDIVIRPHPRSPLRGKLREGHVELPRKITNTYDDFDIDYGYHCLINHNSGPAVQSVIKGTPVICDSSSLAFDISNKFENIENLKFENRSEWLVRLSHTEWTVNELATGMPLQRVLAQKI